MKVVTSPSASLLVLVGAFVAGIAAAALGAPSMSFGWAWPSMFGCFALTAVSLACVKEKKTRLGVAAGSLFLAGACRFLSAAGNSINLLSYLPALLAIKSWLIASVGQMLPEPHAGFLDGLLVGGGARSPSLRAAFIATGTIHVMALSGWNITVINKWLDHFLMFCRLRKKARWLVGSATIIAFVVMTGASASLIRAAVMAMLVVIAGASGRRSAPGRAVLYAACAMLLVTPRIIVDDVGFLLSVAATLGLVYLSPFFEPFTKRLPDVMKFPETVAATLGATLATLPVTLIAFGQTSLVALPANILLLPMVAPTMLAGFIGAIVSSIVPALTEFCGWAVRIFTAYDISVVKLFARIPGASMTGLSFNWLAAIMMTTGMIWIVYKNHDLPLQKKN